MILVKFWFWSFWFFLCETGAGRGGARRSNDFSFVTQRDYVAGRFGAMGFPQNRH
jgi:hypothetical protein